MYEYEYDEIITHWAEVYNITPSREDKASIVNLYLYSKEKLKKDVDFNNMCKHVFISTYLEMKYPHMKMYENLYSVSGMN